MLKKLILENWKSFRYAELPLDPLTVLIGTNASGKSNAIEALDLLNRIAYGGEIREAFFSSVRGGVEWAALKGERSFMLKTVIGDSKSTDYLYSISASTEPDVSLLSESLARLEIESSSGEEKHLVLFNTKDCSSEELEDLCIAIEFNKDEFPSSRNGDSGNVLNFMSDGTSSFLDLLPYTINYAKNKESVGDFFQTLLDIFVLNPIPSKMRSYARMSEDLKNDASNLAGVILSFSNKSSLFEEAVLRYISNFAERDIQKVWAEKVGRLESDAMLYCEEVWVPGSRPMVVDARGMSDGTLRFLAIVTALLTRPEGSQLIIEEVDNGLHPSRAKLLLRMLREIGEKRKIDVLVTTHNPALLDALPLEMVPFVVVAHRDLETGESRLTPLDDLSNLPKLLAMGSLGDIATQGAIERSLFSTN